MSLEEKFAIFFSQFKTDEDIRFLFEFLDCMVTQYKSDPVQVVGTHFPSDSLRELNKLN